MDSSVSPKSLTARGTWKQQLTGSVPIFDNIKFTVKTTEGESIKYDDWESFNADGGDYSIGSEKVWGPEEGLQTLTFFLSEYPSIKTSKNVNVIKIKEPLRIKDIIQYDPINAGNKVSPYFYILVEYSDGTIEKKYYDNYSVEPEFIPVTETHSIDCIFTYSENGFSVSKNYKALVSPREYHISIFSEDGSDAFIKDGMFKRTKMSYVYTFEGPLKLDLRTLSDNKGFRFNKWICSTNLVSLDYKKESTTLIIPQNIGLNITINALWDKYFDEFGNKYTIENGVLKSVDLVDSKMVIPEEVHTIEEGFFVNYSVESIVLPSGLLEIKRETFRDSRIESIEIPESVEIIQESAFEGCVNLKSVKFNQKKAFVIKSRAFMNCTSLSTLDFISLGKNFKDCVFGDDRRDVWNNCVLKTIKLDKSCFAAVKSISKGTSLIGHSGNGFRLYAKSYESPAMASIVYPSEKVESIDLSNVSSWMGSYRVWDSSNIGKENNNECFFSANRNTTLWMESLGLGHPQFNYAVISLPPCRYSFTDENGGYVNDLVYPNIKFNVLSDKMFDDEVKDNHMREGVLEGGSLIDKMLPIYRNK